VRNCTFFFFFPNIIYLFLKKSTPFNYKNLINFYIENDFFLKKKVTTREIMSNYEYDSIKTRKFVDHLVGNYWERQRGGWHCHTSA